MKLRIIRIMIPVVILSIGIIYYYVAPATSVYVPKCPWWLMTGTYCPSCGIQRCIHLLFNGHFCDAFLMNPFVFIVSPYILLAILGKWYNINGVFDKVNRFIYSRKVLITYLILFFTWWAVRIIFKI